MTKVRNILVAAFEAIKPWIRQRIAMSHLYDAYMLFTRGYGAYTGSDRRGYSYLYFVRKQLLRFPSKWQKRS